MKKTVKHGIRFIFIIIALYVLITIVTFLPYGDTIKGALLLVSLILGVVGEIYFRIMRGRTLKNKE